MKYRIVLLILFYASLSKAQEKRVPPDFRQHNLNYFNAQLLNPALALLPQTAYNFNFWSRWQWQTPDNTPTTLFLSGNRNWGNNAAGVAFVQHNTAVYKQTGGALTFARAFTLNESTQLWVGVNGFLFQQEISDESLPPQENSFNLQVAPGIGLKSGNLILGLSAENLYSYNLTQSLGSEGFSEITIIGHLAYQIPVNWKLGAQQTTITPWVYYKSIPEYDAQVGLHALLDTSFFWFQLGYNSYYGPSAGAGGKISKQFSLGGLVELLTEDNLLEQPLSFELVARFNLENTSKYEISPEDHLNDQIVEEANSEPEVDAPATKENPEPAEKEAVRVDGPEEDLPQNENSDLLELPAEENSSEEIRDRLKADDSLAPGYYLIANVFATQKYFEAFMNDLNKQGLEPESFFNEEKGYHYVYLKRTESLEKAIQYRNSGLDGQYRGQLWILQVN